MGDPRWHWRNCRSIGISFQFWPTAWSFGAERNADVYGGEWRMNIGPFSFILHASIGNVSSENRFESWLGLSMDEAWKRSLRFEEPPND